MIKPPLRNLVLFFGPALTDFIINPWATFVAGEGGFGTFGPWASPISRLFSRSSPRASEIKTPPLPIVSKSRYFLFSYRKIVLSDVELREMYNIFLPDSVFWCSFLVLVWLM